MAVSDLENELRELMTLPGETECVEFKQAKNSYDFGKIGKYFSALSNEANLQGQQNAWLIFGVKDNPREIVSTNFRPDRPSLDSLKEEIARQTTSRITFDEIHELRLPEGRVLMFKIPPALRGIPTGWKGHFYGREGESLAALSMNELEQIRGQASWEDWSAKVCIGAKLDDLVPDAIAFAREQYKDKHPRQTEEVDEWEDLRFLNKARICIDGQMTNAAIVLLGKPESASLLSPAVSRLSWILKDDAGAEKDYEHFDPPMLLSADRILKKLRILTLRKMPKGTLFPKEILQYDNSVIRELLNNCIAHQDYGKCEHVSLIEHPDTLLFTNAGQFIPGSVEEVIRSDAPSARYRNRFLAEAMVNLNMIDTIGSGIKKVFRTQKERFFPMPDYDFDNMDHVAVRLYGSILDEDYTQVLIEHADLDLQDVIALDKVQKKRELKDDDLERLKVRKLVRGRGKNLSVRSFVSANDEPGRTKTPRIDKKRCIALIESYLKEFGEARREDLDKLLSPEMPDGISPEQRDTKIKNLLQGMRKSGLIEAIGSRKGAKWVLPENDGDPSE